MTEKTEVKHGGCKKCGTRDQEVLVSMTIPGEVMSIAVCDNCRKEATPNGTK